MRRIGTLTAGLLLLAGEIYAGYSAEQQHFWRTVMPIMRKHCNDACHNTDANKGGLNLSQFDFILSIQRRGEVFVKVIEEVENGTMPPKGKPALAPADKDTFLFYIRKYLADAVSTPDPGLIPAHRLSNREYKYAVLDLTGIHVPTEAIFPKDAAGGEGFDNYAQTLYLSSLEMERYLEVAELVVEEMYCHEELWQKYMPAQKTAGWQGLKQRWRNFWKRSSAQESIRNQAQKAVAGFATLAYRRYLDPLETQDLLTFFHKVYQSLPSHPDRFDRAMKEVYKAILVSPNFLMRQEADPAKKDPYPVSNFELASRLSFFLWSSMPDEQLLETAYREDLHDPKVLKGQVARMLQSPKVKRMAESFASQWLEVDRLKDPTHQIDSTLFPSYSEGLKESMGQEAVLYFYHTLTQSKNFLELLSGNYTFLNEDLANHYGIEGVQGEEMRKVDLQDALRGGVLGMAGVLTATSLPNRTSPVLRGKWVLEKILATAAKPPPPNVPELKTAKEAQNEISLRELMVLHRDNVACRGCHQEMDDLGFALENFDAIGRWRSEYKPGSPAIDVSGSLKTGEQFNGPVELKAILMEKKDRFAKGISKKMLGFALGRSIEFKDSQVIEHLAETLVKNNFNPDPFIEEIVMSYPFRFKKSDPVVVDNEFGPVKL